MTDTGIFEFITSENGDIALFIHAREAEHNHPVFRFFASLHKAELYRCGEDMVIIEPIEDKIAERLLQTTKLLVCEVLPAENEGELEITAAYRAAIVIER